MFAVLCHNNGPYTRPNQVIDSKSTEIARNLRLVRQLGLTAPLHFSTAGKSSYLLNIRVNLGSIESL